MAISTTSINTRVNDGSGTWVDPGSGGGSSQNTDLFLSSTASRARKVSNTSDKGFGFQINASGEDITGLVFSIRWLVTAGVGSLDSRTNGGVSLFVQDTSGNISYWDVDGNDTYQGGWKNTVVDMANSPSRNSGTAATLTAAEYVGMVWSATAGVGGGDPNCYIDEILSWPQAGLTITGNTSAFIDDLVDAIDLDSGSVQHNIFERRAGVVFSKARIIVQQDATDISETDRTLIFEDPVYDAGANIDSALDEIGIVNDNATAGELFTLTRCTVEAAAPDEAVTNEANKEFDFTTADNASFDTTVIKGFNGTVMHLGDTTNSYDDCTFQACSQIVDAGAVVRRGFVRDTAATGLQAAVLWTSSSDWEDTQFFMGSANSHALEIESSITDTWTGFSFTGYATTDGSVGDEVLVNNSNGANYTISGVGVTGTVSIRNAGTSTATFSASVGITITVVDTAGDPIQGARVFLEEDPGGADVISYDTTNVSGQVTASFAGGTPQAVTGFVRKGTCSPVYKPSPINDTIGASGLSAVITLVSDE